AIAHYIPFILVVLLLLHVLYSLFFFILLRPPSSTLFPYTTLFRSSPVAVLSSRTAPPGTSSGTACPSTSRVHASSTSKGPSAPGAVRSPWTSLTTSSEVTSKVFRSVTVAVPRSPSATAGTVTAPSAGTTADAVAPPVPVSVTVQAAPTG